MFSKTNLLSTVATTIWAFFGGYLVFDIIGSMIMEHADAAEPCVGSLAVGCLILAFAFSVIYAKWAGEDHSIMNGATFGLWVGILIGFGSGIIDMAVHGGDMKQMLIAGVLCMVYYALMGAVASLVHSKA